MNRTYRLIFNKSLGMIQVVSELAKSHGKKSAGKSPIGNANYPIDQSNTTPFKFNRITSALALSFATCLVISSSNVMAQASGGAGGGGTFAGGNGGAGGTSGAGTAGAAGASGTQFGNYGLGGTGGTGGSTGNSGTSISSNNTGSAGGNGNDATGSYAGGGGGGGGGVGFWVSSPTSLTNSFTQTAGAGGSGGGGGVLSFLGGGAGGTAGNGGAGISGSGFTLSNAGSSFGGAGGSGGAGGYSNSPGTAGNGGAGISGSGFTLNNSGSSSGGNGGAGGLAPIFVTGGSGGNGGAGVSGATFTLNNSGSITGGNGGNGAVGGYLGGFGGAGGNGGAGVQVLSGSVTNMTISSGVIAGGSGGAGGNGGGGGGPSAGGNGGAGGAGVQVLSGSTVNINLTGGAITGGSGGAGGAGVAGGAVGANGTGGAGIQVDAGGVIGTLTNAGSISGNAGSAGINNQGTIQTLNNGQSALTYSGTLPTRYNIILGSTFGKLSYVGGGGTLPSFGIYSGSITSRLYAGVLTGITAVTSGTTGTYNGQSYQLSLESGSTSIWDLIFSNFYAGPSTVDTQQSIVNTASVLQNIYTLQSSVLANSFSYDCNLFDVNNICVSVGGRNTAVSAANGLNNTSGLLIAAYRPQANYRIGAYIDQNLSVNNSGSTVTLGNNTPLIGLFGAWSERLDGTGTEVKVSAAYGQKNTTITRAVVGTSEAGSGSSQLNSQGVQAIAKYGFSVAQDVLVSPYAGIRYTQNNMGGYTEGSSASVTAPLTYSALNTNATTILVGVGASYRGIPNTNLFASAGLESDTNTQNSSINATGVAGLSPVNFNPNPVKNRPTATLGATYDVAKNQRLGIAGIYRQEAYQAVSSTSILATYTVGL